MEKQIIEGFDVFSEQPIGDLSIQLGGSRERTPNAIGKDRFRAAASFLPEYQQARGPMTAMAVAARRLVVH